MKPMLSAVTELDKIRYPAYCTPKLDGIRCLITDDGAVSRSLKPIRNKFVQDELRTVPVGLDGELMLAHKATFQEITSAVMSEDGEPDFVFMVFDDWTDPHRPYVHRICALDEDFHVNPHSRVQVLFPDQIHTEEALLAYEEKCLRLGFEGVMIRTGDGIYKYGRSTVRQGYLTKLKRFADSEAEIVGFIEEMHNDNEATTNALGRTERSHAKDGMRPKGTLGALEVKDIHSGVEFKIGTGFDAKARQTIWDYRKSYVGEIVKYKYQPVGEKEKPRFPVFLGFRHKEDM